VAVQNSNGNKYCIVIEINKCHLLLKHTICPFPALIPTLYILHELFPSTAWAQHSPFIKSLTEIAYIFAIICSKFKCSNFWILYLRCKLFYNCL